MEKSTPPQLDHFTFTTKWKHRFCFERKYDEITYTKNGM